MSNIEIELAEEIAKYYHDPVGFCLFAFPWGEKGTSLEGFDGLDAWQMELLGTIGKAVVNNSFNGVDAVAPVKVAVCSGHGIGKSALTAMIILWIMSTRPFCKGVVTANTLNQLRTKTFGEVAKWANMCITGHWFECSSMSVVHKKHDKTWRTDAIPSSEHNAEGFAGLHCSSSSPFYLR